MKITLAIIAGIVFIVAPAATQADDQLKVGFGKAIVTPKLGDKPVFIAGFGQNRIVTAILDELHVRAIVLKNGDHKIAMASVDVVGLFLPFVNRIRQRLPDFDYVLVTSTHNHHGPDTMGLWGSSPISSGVNSEYMAALEKQIVAAIRSAEQTLQPATAKIGFQRCPELIHDSRAPIVKHDDLVVVQFLNASGQPVGLIVQWNCHPETLNSKSTTISADFVGVTVAELEKKHHCPVVYLTGTVGGLMTSMHVDVRDAGGARMPEGSVEKTRRYGELLAQAAERAVRSSKPLTLTPFALDRASILLPVDNPLYRFARQVGVFDRDMETWAGDAWAKPGPLLQKVEGRPAVRSEIGRLQLGELDVAVIPGEIYPELVVGGIQDPPEPNADFPDAPKEPTIYSKLKSPYRMIVGLGNDELGYILPKRQWDAVAPYCYGLKKAPYGEINSLGAETGPIICASFQKLEPRRLSQRKQN